VVNPSTQYDVEVYRVNRASIEQDWHSRGFTCGVWVDPPGQEWVDYVHSTDELVMVVEGELGLEMQERTFHLKLGEEVLIPAHTSHTVRNVGGTTAWWLYGYKNREV
jgi:mannose-6-phosphate isomerase-like protein (cupin superfamily)